MLRVLHVNATQAGGGAARAAWRLHLAQRAIGIDSKMVVLEHGPEQPFVLRPLDKTQRLVHRATRAASRALMALQYATGNPVVHSLNLFPSGLGAWLARADVDIVHLHWLGSEALSIGEIARLGPRVCWTLHDMWTFCGAEHYDDLDTPGRYRTPYLPSNRPPGHRGLDLDAWTWHRKRSAWAQSPFHFVAPSRWMAACVSASALMPRQRVSVLPNCLDTSLFRPVDRGLARFRLGLPDDRTYILFGAASGTGDRRKGFALLCEALRRLASLPLPRPAELLVFGSVDPAARAALPLPMRELGVMDDDVRMADMYSAADVFALPSLLDNLPNTVAEALACGTPCVAFDAGGVPDLIDHGRNGALVAPRDAHGFGESLVDIATRTNYLRDACRLKAESTYAMPIVAARHESLYRSVLRETTMRSDDDRPLARRRALEQA